MGIAPYEILSVVGRTVDVTALFGVGISGSGAGAETILLTKRKRKFYVIVW